MKNLHKLLDYTASLLNEKGISKASMSVSEKETLEFTVEAGEFTLLRTLFDNSISVMAFEGTKAGAVSGNDISEDGIRKTVGDAILAAEAANEDPYKDIAPKQENEVFRKEAFEGDTEKLFMRLKEFSEAVKEQYPKILMMQSYAKHVKIHSLYRNTNGTEFENFDGYYLISSEFAGNDGQKTTGLNGGYAIVKNLDTPFIEQDSVRMHLDEAVSQLDQTELKGKFTGTVIFTPDCTGQFVSFLMENYISDRVILDGTSKWKEKLGEKIASEKLTIVSDPYDGRFAISSDYTYEGFKTVSLPIIEKGVLKNFVIDLYTASKTGNKPSRSSGSNCFMTTGDTSFEDMVGKVKKGIIIGSFSGGEPSANGEFSGVAKNAFLIEDGRIKGAVNETMINGNLEEMFNNITEISSEAINSGADIFPYMACDGIVISGK